MTNAILLACLRQAFARICGDNPYCCRTAHPLNWQDFHGC